MLWVRSRRSDSDQTRRAASKRSWMSAWERSPHCGCEARNQKCAGRSPSSHVRPVLHPPRWEAVVSSAGPGRPRPAPRGPAPPRGGLSAWSLRAVRSGGNAAIFLTDGFLRRVAVAGFNQFIISPSLGVLTVGPRNLIALAVPQGIPTRARCTTGEFFG